MVQRKRRLQAEQRLIGERWYMRDCLIIRTELQFLNAINKDIRISKSIISS